MVSLEKNDHLMLARQLPLKSVALILAGGRGTRLKDLTNKRAKPAVHFGGKFRIIDFALSNCINSGIRRMGVITQYQSHTLVQHIQRGWSFFNEEMNEFVDLLPAQQRHSHHRQQKACGAHHGAGQAAPGGAADTEHGPGEGRQTARRRHSGKAPLLRQHRLHHQRGQQHRQQQIDPQRQRRALYEHQPQGCLFPPVTHKNSSPVIALSELMTREGGFMMG